MLFIQSVNRNPFFNLAAEEFLLKNTAEEVFMLWKCNPVVVTGKHQNAFAEINYRFVREHDILVARRLTGGGTVYHDPGNINFTFIINGKQETLVNFDRFAEPIIGFLKTIDIEAKSGTKHEIYAGNRKISGNAEHVYKNRVLHHGTLLFNADLKILRKAIQHKGGTYTDRSVQSNRSSVANISDYIPEGMSNDDFCNFLFQYITGTCTGSKFSFDQDQTGLIQQLADDKYSKRDWIYGWSPDYEYINSWRSGDKLINIGFLTHRGRITRSDITGSFTPDRIAELNRLLTGADHEEETIRKNIEICGIKSLLAPEEFEDLVFSFF